MKLHKALSSLFCMSLLIAVVANFTACGNNSSGGDATAPAAPAATVCAAGQVLTQFGCLATANCVGAQVGFGFYPASNSCYPPSASSTIAPTYSQTGRWGATILGVNSAALNQLLTDSRLCNRNNIANWFAENCSRYSNQANIVLTYNGGSSVYVQINAGISNPDYSYFMNYATGGSYNGGYGNGTLTVSTSLQITASGTAGVQMSSAFNPYSFSGSSQGLVITDANENFNNSTMNLTITYSGQTIGTASVSRF